jgi:rubrerythrin
MGNSNEKIIEALKFAIQMELDGKRFYLQAGERSDNPVGKELFTWLAGQEDRHRETFEQIYKSLADKHNWPSQNIKPYRVKMGTIFGNLIKSADKNKKPGKEDLEASSIAIEMEIKSRDYYGKCAEMAVTKEEGEFYRSLSAEEQGHYLSLIDYKEYVMDPVNWFTRSEHHLLDGA